MTAGAALRISIRRLRTRVWLGRTSPFPGGDAEVTQRQAIK
jgi:hypothetical protein